MYRLVAVDLDDTLLDEGLDISPQTREVIGAVQQLGVIITLATGRMFCSAAAIARRLRIETPIVAYQGAIIKNPLSEEELIHRTLHSDLAKEIIDFLSLNQCHINIYIGDNLYMKELTAEGENYAATSRVEARVVGDLQTFIGSQTPTKILAIAPEEKLVKIMADARQSFPADSVNINRSKPYFLEFGHPLATKGAALEFLAIHYQIPRAAVMAIGDGYNDLDMLQYAGLGVVVHNAREEIKRHADYVTSRPNTQGVAEALQKFILDDPRSR